MKPSLPPLSGLREKTDDTSGEDNDEKEAVTSKGRKTANSQGRRKGRITRSMANEANSEEAVTPQQSAELGESWAGDSESQHSLQTCYLTSLCPDGFISTRVVSNAYNL